MEKRTKFNELLKVVLEGLDSRIEEYFDEHQSFSGKYVNYSSWVPASFAATTETNQSQGNQTNSNDKLTVCDDFPISLDDLMTLEKKWRKELVLKPIATTATSCYTQTLQQISHMFEITDDKFG